MTRHLSMQRPVVVGYDGSPSSRVALEWAAAQAERESRPLRIVEAFELVVASRPSEGRVVPLQTLRDNREKALTSVAEGIKKQHRGLTVFSTLVTQDPAPALIAESAHAGLMVLGSRGLGGWSGLLVGSVGVQVGAHALCPVVIVPHDNPAEGREPVIVVGVDGSKVSTQAIQFAFTQAAATGARVVAVHAWHSPATTYDGRLGPLLTDSTETARAAQSLITESIAGAVADHPDVEFDTVAVEGQPARALLSAGESAALIVVGSRGRGGFTGLLLGSVSQAVLHHAHVPVAIVR